VNFNLLGRLEDNATRVPGRGHRLLNNLGFAGGEEVAQLDATACTVAGNSFLGGWAATAADFAGLDEADLTRPRQPNGQLPVTSLLRLAPGSRAIDVGVPWGEPFAGRAPDAGAFEAGAAR
jgi:pectate lyase